MVRLILPFKKSKQETGDEKCLAICDETLADSNDAPQYHLNTARHSLVWTEPLHYPGATYGIQLSGPTFLLIS
jgi:hypothetical protein